MSAKPEAKANELLDRLHLLTGRGQPDEFSLRRIEQEIQLLMKSDATAAYMLMGIVCSIKGDVEGSRSNHEKSLALRDDALLRENYGNSLGHLQMLAEALDQFDLSIRHVSSPRLLRRMVTYAIQTGYPKRAFAYYHQLVKLEPSVKDDPELVNMMTTASRLIESGLSDQDIAAIHAIAEHVAKDFGTEITHIENWLDDISLDKPSVVVRLHTPYPDVFDLNWELAGRFAEANTEALRSRRYHVSFTGNA